ncbi:MAG: hypothetical protein DI556_13555 [Rhodovulum sulfidophilum]|uniref:Bacteriophage T7 Gp4 DNA primase/helicase N-terminal domain-containing protein n=1 Tax=Rhodovulum sulfidophilum TaxID=35806 RepID=A0A2W5N5X3_RHOSU|nr:MAG: hypothetical protein DI556_13555 [Rhodovulum sulfidophilum]
MAATTMVRRQGGFARAKSAMAGRWRAFFLDRYPAFEGALARPGKSRITCPMHGTGKAAGDGFRFYDDFDQTGGGICNTCGGARNGLDLVMMIEGCPEKDALTILEQWLGWDRSAPRESPLPRKMVATAPAGPDAAEVEKRMLLLRRLWADASKLADLPDEHPAIRYLMGARGIASRRLINKQFLIRFHPRLYYREDGDTRSREYPGLLSAFRDENRVLTGLHRTYLDPIEFMKARVSEPTKALRRLDVTLNGGIHLQGESAFTHHVNLAEGIENGLSVVFATGKPVVSATTARLLANWVPFEGTRFVTIWADRDEISAKTGKAAGVHHALLLKERLEASGIRVRIILPPPHPMKPSNDWNDVLRTLGPDAFVEAYTGGAQKEQYA